MKLDKLMLVASLVVGMTGCLDTAGTRVTVDTETGEASVLENSQRLANKVKVTKVTYDDVGMGLKKATITLESTTKSRLSIQGRMVWLDADGTEIDADGKPYRAMILDGLDTCTFTGVAPNPKGVRAKLQVRLTENSSRTLGILWPGNW